DDVFEVHSPVDGFPVGEHPAFNVDQALSACARAAAVQPEWASWPLTQRRRVLLDAADLLESEGERIAREFAAETGSTAAWSTMNVHEAAATFREAAGLVSSPVGDI